MGEQGVMGGYFSKEFDIMVRKSSYRKESRKGVFLCGKSSRISRLGKI